MIVRRRRNSKMGNRTLRVVISFLMVLVLIPFEAINVSALESTDISIDAYEENVSENLDMLLKNAASYNLKFSSFDSTDLTYGEVQWKDSSEKWHTQTETGEVEAKAVRVKYANNGKLADHTAFRKDGVDTMADSKAALESEEGFVIPEDSQYEMEHVEFISADGSGGGNPGGNGGGNTNFTWNTLDQTDSRIASVQYKLQRYGEDSEASEWTTYDRNGDLTLGEGDRIRVKLIWDESEDGTAYTIEELSLIYQNKNDERVRYLYQYGIDENKTTTTPEEVKNDLFGEDGYVITFKPGEDSKNADNESGLTAENAILRLQFSTKVRMDSIAEIFVYTQVKNDQMGYGIEHEGEFIDNTGIDELEFQVNGNRYGGQGAPLNLGYGFINNGEGKNSIGEAINGGNKISIRYPTKYVDKSGLVDAEPFEFGYFEVGAYSKEGGKKNTFAIADTLIDEVYVISGDGNEFTEDNKLLPKEDGSYAIELDETKTKYSILIRKHEPSTRNIGWHYTARDVEDDAYVDHGKVFIERIQRGDTVILDGIQKDASGNVVLNENGEPAYALDLLNTDSYEGNGNTNAAGGDYNLEKGDIITIKLIPTYGYQIAAAEINGTSLTPNEEISSFTFTINRNLHLAGSFVKTEDKTDVSSAEGISAATITGGENAAESGNLSLEVKDHEGSYANAEAATSKVLEGNTEKEAETLQTLDLSLTNIVSKGEKDSYWVTDVTEFAEDIMVGLTMKDVEIQTGEELAVVREHEGVLTKVNATYDAGTGVLAVSTNQFSTYSIIKVGQKQKFSNPKTVTFDLQGGLFTKQGYHLPEVMLERGSLLDKPDFGADNQLKKGTLIFQGWFKDKNCTEEWNFETDKVIKDMTLYAGYGFGIDEQVTDTEAVMSVSAVPDYDYTGQAIKPIVTVKFGKKTLTAGKDYTVVYKNNINANPRKTDGSLETGGIGADFQDNLPTIIVKGKGNYQSEIALNFTIRSYEISTLNDVVTANITDCIRINPKAITSVNCTVKVGKKTLARNKDYSVILQKLDEKNNVIPSSDYPNLKVPKGETGKYRLTITAINNYCGGFTKDILLTESDSMLNMCKATISMNAISYEGTPLRAEDIKKKIKSVKIGKTKLEEGEYEIELSSPVISSAGTYAVTFVGKDKTKIAGSKQIMVTVRGVSISSAKASFSEKAVYNDLPHETNGMQLKMRKNGTDIELIEGTDYVVSVKTNDVKVGTVTLQITGIGSYQGTKKVTYKIVPYEWKNGDSNISIEPIGTLCYQKGGVTPNVVIKFAGKQLKKGIDYTLSYKDNKKVGTEKVPLAKVIITGKGNFKGKIDNMTFQIRKGSFAEAGVTVNSADVIYNKNKPTKYQTSITVLDGNGKKLVAGTDYKKEVKYYLYNDSAADHKGAELTKESTPAQGSKILVEITGIETGNYVGTAYGVYRIVGANISKAVVTCNKKTFTGDSIILESKDISSAKLNGESLTYGEDYEIVEGSYINNVNVGKAKVTIRGLGDYGGTKVITFQIEKKRIK